MNDLISRQAAIDALVREDNKHPFRNMKFSEIAKCIRELPSAQPERLADDDFETIRIHLNAYKEKLCNQRRWKEAEEYQHIIDRFMAFASAQPDLDEWCYSCSEYDAERHCCPRWNRVIREALKEAQPERKKMSNKEWVDFLSEQFTVSRTTAREMLHALMKWKGEDNFKKQFSGGKNEKK